MLIPFSIAVASAYRLVVSTTGLVLVNIRFPSSTLVQKAMDLGLGLTQDAPSELYLYHSK